MQETQHAQQKATRTAQNQDIVPTRMYINIVLKSKDNSHKQETNINKVSNGCTALEQSK